MSTSVFARVDQGVMVARVGSGGGDLIDSPFFEAVRPSGGSTDAFREGIVAFGGASIAGPTLSDSSPEVVSFSGELLENRAACIAFIAHGPDGVLRH